MLASPMKKDKARQGSVMSEQLIKNSLFNHGVEALCFVINMQFLRDNNYFLI